MLDLAAAGGSVVCRLDLPDMLVVWVIQALFHNAKMDAQGSSFQRGMQYACLTLPSVIAL